jgi:hypothetical protein
MECEKMHGMNNIKITDPRFEVHMIVLLHNHIFCHVIPCHQVKAILNTSKDQEASNPPFHPFLVGTVPGDEYSSPVNKE